MGYRLSIDIIDKFKYEYDEPIKCLYYGTKLYGYDLDLSESLSYNYLVSINKFTGEEYFNYGMDNEITLNYKELVMFLKLYAIDYSKSEWGKDCNFLDFEEIEDIITNVKYENYNFLIYWC